jgi:hypothetical protein
MHFVAGNKLIAVNNSHNKMISFYHMPETKTTINLTTKSNNLDFFTSEECITNAHLVTATTDYMKYPVK